MGKRTKLIDLSQALVVAGKRQTFRVVPSGTCGTKTEWADRLNNCSVCGPIPAQSASPKR